MSQPFGTYTPGTINVRLSGRSPGFGSRTSPTQEEILAAGGAVAQGPNYMPPSQSWQESLGPGRTDTLYTTQVEQDKPPEGARLPAGWSTGSASPVKTTATPTPSSSKTPYLIAAVVLAGFGIWLATKS